MRTCVIMQYAAAVGRQSGSAYVSVGARQSSTVYIVECSSEYHVALVYACHVS